MEANAMFTLNSDTNFHAWATLAGDDHVHMTMNALDPALPYDNTCHYNMGVNCHVFHDCNAFAYESTIPITVQGFGHNLSTIVIGWGTV
jgi:hypothetical protein